MKINKNYANVAESYLFSDIAKRVEIFTKNNPDKKVIKMGIGDVTLPLCDAVIKKMHSAVDEMSKKETFKGYGPEQGYAFLRNSIKDYYKSHSVELGENEIFISDGAKSDLGNILDLFDKDNVCLVPDPVYPVYVDTNVMTGRKIVFMNANEDNGFLPLPDKNVKCDIIYICSPNNPTGAVYNYEQLKMWVDYALENGAVILFDSAYEAFVEDDLPRSIFEIDGAKKCAVEFCSFSKTAGFTGTRCGFTVVPSEVCGTDKDGNRVALKNLWGRRQGTKFNGVPYVIQRAAEAVYSDEGKKQIKENIRYYLDNAALIKKGLTAAGYTAFGGEHSPYVWVKTPDGMGSWEFFDYLLKTYAIVTTPGEGFGQCGEGYFRLTAFGDRNRTREAVERIRNANLG